MHIKHLDICWVTVLLERQETCLQPHRQNKVKEGPKVTMKTRLKEPTINETFAFYELFTPVFLSFLSLSIDFAACL